MAYFEKLAKGGYRAHVQKCGQRDSDTFPNKREAQLWAAQREIEIQTIAKGKGSTLVTTHQIFDKYKEEVCINHKGERWEKIRLDKMKGDFPNIMLDKVTAQHIVAWRQTRLSEVKGSSVLREMKLLSSVFEKCCGVEWKLLDHNPCRGVDRPKGSPHRKRTITLSEIRIMLRELSYPARTKPRNATAYAFLLALRTGMRQGELAAIRWENVFPKYIFTDSKSMEEFTREVPLSRQAKRIVAAMRGYHPETMFDISAASIDTHFRNAKTRAGVSGFTFHDSRHTAATWIGRSGKFQLLELCKAFGWKDPKHALIYFNPTGDDLSDKL